MFDRGDKVKVIRLMDEDIEKGISLGDVGTVVDDCGSCPDILFDDVKYPMWTSQLELVTANTVVEKNDIEIIRDINPIQRINVPTVDEDCDGYTINGSTLDIVDIYAHDNTEHVDSDVIGVHVEDIPLLIKALEVLYDEYMDGKDEN